MSLLILIFLINATEMKPLADSDSLEIKPLAVTTSEGEEEKLQYTFGMDAYSAGFNKGSISTNILEEKINTSNGNLELKIKLLSLPMRGNKDYDLYLTYRGSPLSIPGMSVNRIDNPPYRCKKYGYDNPDADVEEYIYDHGDTNSYLVTADMGNCGLGWNVMPGEVSLNADWQRHNVSGSNRITCSVLDPTARTDGFINLNGQSYSIYSLGTSNTRIWHVKGKRNWKFQTYKLYTPGYTCETDYSVYYPNPYGFHIYPKRELNLLSKMTDHNGNYVEFTWWDYAVDDPPGARIPEKICTPTDTCYIYIDSIVVDTNQRLRDAGEPPYCLWNFYVIDSIVKNVNGEKFKVNFYYHQEWFRMIREYWYGNAFVLLDSVEFLRNGDRIKPPYRFKYDTCSSYDINPEYRQGELIELVTSDSAKYEYFYDDKIYLSYDLPGYPPDTVWHPMMSKYRVVKQKIVTLPDATHIESGNGSNVCEYEYTFGNSVGANSGEWWPEVGTFEEVFHKRSYFPIYDTCRIDMPDTGSITYFNVDSVYVNNLLKVNYRNFDLNCSIRDTVILPFEREEFYGRPYKIVTSNSRNLGANYRLKAEHFYWTISGEVLTPCGYKLRYPLHPFLRYKAVQLNPNNDNINVGEKAYVYHYPEYDQYDNQKRVCFLGEATLTGTLSYTIQFDDDQDLSQEWQISCMPEWGNDNTSDNWELRKDYVYEQDEDYTNAFLYNLVSSEKKYEWPYDTDDIIGRVDFEYDGNPLNSVTNAPMHEDAPYAERGNLTKKTEWINENDEKRSQQYWYDECGNLVTMRDYMNYDYDYGYDPEYVFPDIATSPDGFITDFNFDKEGNLTSVTDKSGIIDTFEHDIYGRLTRYRKGIPGELSLLKEYQYDDFERWARARSYYSINWNDATDYYYDALGRLIHLEKIAPAPVVMDYIYNGDGQLVKETQPRFSDVSLYDADYTIKTFDALGRVAEIEYPKSSSEDGTEFVTYEYNGNITDVIDEEEYYTTLINDAAGNLVKVVDALYINDTTCYDYDLNGNLLKITDTEGKEIDFEYDWLGNLVRREGPDRGIDIFEYDANGNTKYHKNNSGDEIEFEYDELNRIEVKRVNNQVEETYYYDDYDNIGGVNYDAPEDLEYPEGRLTGFQNPNVTEVYFYDKFGNLAEKLIFLSTGYVDTIEYSYDLKGRLTELQYPGGDFKVNYIYDHFDNISSVEINDGETLTLSSTASRLLSTIDFPGEVTDTFTYLPRNWMVEMKVRKTSDLYWRYFEYNLRGELTGEWDPNYQDAIAEYTYDPLGRLIIEDRQGAEDDHYFSYDKVGNRTIVNGEPYNYEMGTDRLRYIGQDVEYDYNDIGCINSKTDLDGTTNFTYDDEGRLVCVELPDGQNGYKYYYKGRQRIREEKLTDIEHTQTLEGVLYSCKLKWEALPEGILEAVFMNDDNNEIGTLTLVSEQVLHGTHDWIEFSDIIPPEDLLPGTHTVKLRVRIVESHPDAHLWVGDMSIDLLWEDGGISGDVEQPSDYFYDNAGNLILVNSVGSGAAANPVQNPGFETGDLSGWDASGGGVSGFFGPYEGEYCLVLFGGPDSVCQEISLSETVSSPITISCFIAWAEGFKLKAVLKGDGIYEEYSSDVIDNSTNWTQVSLTIDSIPEGTSSCEIRLIKTIGNTIYLLVDNVVCELETEQEISTKYIYAGSRLLAKDENGELFFYHLDRIGSPIMITDESGDIVKQKKYEAFGNLVWAEGDYEDNREFTSKEKDPTGFHYFGARYYSGDIGRFLSPDPHTLSPGGFELSDPQTLNPYSYCTNDPLYYFDPEGLYRIRKDNTVYPVTPAAVFLEAGTSIVPIMSIFNVAFRTIPNSYYPGEYITVADLILGLGGVTGLTSVPSGALTSTGIVYGLNQAATDRITLGMFAAKYPETVISPKYPEMSTSGDFEIDLNRINPDKMGTKNKAAAIEKAKVELKQMEKFAKEIRKGRTPKWIVENGLSPYEYLEYYEIYMNGQKVGSYRGGIYHDEHGLYTAEY